MLEQKYHAHLICDPNDQIEVLDNLSIAMERKAFLTKDLHISNIESSSYSRRCIDNCDYVVMVIGDSYGKLHKTGVSQLHLSYIHAESKKKPMCILIKSHQDKSQVDRKLQDFIGMVAIKSGDIIHYYNDSLDIKRFFEPIHSKLIQENNLTGWSRQADKASAFAFKSNFNKTISDAKKQSEMRYHSRKTSAQNMLSASNAPSKPNLPITGKTVEQKVAQTAHIDYTKFKEVVELHDSVTLNFTTHAYQDGNLNTINLVTSLQWRQILLIIYDNDCSIDTIGYYDALNALLADIALELAKEEVSDKIHAVSRTQILRADGEWTIEQMIRCGWIRKSTNPSRVRKKFGEDSLILTELGKQVLQKG